MKEKHKRKTVSLIRGADKVLQRLIEYTPYSGAEIIWLVLNRYEQDFIASTNEYLNQSAATEYITPVPEEKSNSERPKIFNDQDF